MPRSTFHDLESLRVGGASGPRPPGMMSNNLGRRPKAPPTLVERATLEPLCWGRSHSPLDSQRDRADDHPDDGSDNGTNDQAKERYEDHALQS